MFIIAGFILILILSFIGGSIYMMIEGIRDKEFLLFIMGLILLSIVMIPTVAVIYDSYQIKLSTLITEEVILVVEDKKHEPSWTQVISNGKATSTIYHSESWDVTLTDGKNSDTKDDEDLYSSLNIGDKIEGYRDTYIKKNGDIYKVVLRIKGFEEE